MADSQLYPFPCTRNTTKIFQSADYRTWKDQMICLLEHGKLLGFNVDDDEQVDDQSTAKQVKKLILSSVFNSEVCSGIANFTTARQAWMEMEVKSSTPTVTIVKASTIYQNPNYRIWKEHILRLIETNKLLGFIDGTISPPDSNDPGFKRWKKTDGLVKGWILSSINNREVIITSDEANLDTARQVWLELEKMFYNSSDHTKEIKEIDDHAKLFKAASDGIWADAEYILKKERKSYDEDDDIFMRLDPKCSIIHHLAVGNRENADFFMNLVRHFPGKVTCEGYSGLTMAAATGNLKAAQALLNERGFGLLSVKDAKGNYPVHVAAMYAQREMFAYLLHLSESKGLYYDNESGIKLVINAIDSEFYDIASYLVKKYPQFARMSLSDGNSALKCIAGKKRTFASERRLWKRVLLPSAIVEQIVKRCLVKDIVGFEAKRSGSGEIEVKILKICKSSCIRRKGQDINMMESQTQNKRITGFLRICRRHLRKLWKFFEPHVSSMKRLKQKMSALQLVKTLSEQLNYLDFEKAHGIYGEAIILASRLENHEVVQEIMKTCPASIYSVSDEGESIFHVAARNHSENVFFLLHQKKEHIYVFANMTDAKKNNLLHLAACLGPMHVLDTHNGPALQMQRELQWYEDVRSFVPSGLENQYNNDKKTPQMIFSEQHEKLRQAGEIWMKNTASACAINSALISTVMFTAAMTMPDRRDPKTNTPFSSKSSFKIFGIADVIALFTSATSLLLFLSILTSRYAERDFLRRLPQRLIFGLATLFISITFMMLSFTAMIFLLYCGEDKWFIFPVSVLASLPIASFLFLQYPLIFELSYWTYFHSIYGGIRKCSNPVSRKLVKVVTSYRK